MPVIAALLAVLMGSNWWWLLGALAAAAALYLFIGSYLELVHIIGDTLLPR
ncbi:hypothetical protein [Sinorhizobium medicae]|uniref:hypothetical protein n=1 Tax=Sinorhizobium medicae TaxID=110321 RepID=UPI0013E338C1|nr:hypothetical protein [Sinorhizobium medicae]